VAVPILIYFWFFGCGLGLGLEEGFVWVEASSLHLVPLAEQVTSANLSLGYHSCHNQSGELHTRCIIMQHTGTLMTLKTRHNQVEKQKQASNLLQFSIRSIYQPLQAWFSLASH